MPACYSCSLVACAVLLAPRRNVKQSALDTQVCAPDEVLTAMPAFRSNSNPEDRRVTPENVNGRKKFKVVYVVLESQYQASMTVACKRINAGQVLLPPRHTVRSALGCDACAALHFHSLCCGITHATGDTVDT